MTAQMHNFWLILNTAMHQGEYAKQVQLEEPVDWAYLSMQARKQNLLPIFVDIAQQYESYRVSPGFAKDTLDAMAMVAVQIQKNTEFLDLYKAFLSQGLSPIVFKGIVLRQIYGQYGDLRVSGDEDILIRPEEYESVREVLECRGYQCKNSELIKQRVAHIREVAFYNADIQFSIEVHINLFSEKDPVRAYMNRAVHPFEDTEILEIDGVRVRIMNPSQSYLHLVFHSFHHFFDRGMGIRHVMDILKYAEVYKERICFREIEEILKPVRADAFLRDIRWIGNQYFGFPAEGNTESCCPQDFLDDLTETGVFGGLEKTDHIAANISLYVSTFAPEKRKLYGLLMGAFPDRAKLVEGYPCLAERPWLLPAVWLRRFVKFGRYAGKDIISVLREIFNKSDKRAALLKKYRE